jgi:hypothetical protein
MNRRSVLGASAITILGLAVIPDSVIAQQATMVTPEVRQALARPRASCASAFMPTVHFRWFATPCLSRSPD